MGGVPACLDVADRYDVPIVVSSAMESSVGLAAGLALALALPELPYACGLGTSAHELVTSSSPAPHQVRTSPAPRRAN